MNPSKNDAICPAARVRSETSSRGPRPHAPFSVSLLVLHHHPRRDAIKSAAFGALLLVPVGWFLGATTYRPGESACGALPEDYPVMVRGWIIASTGSCAALGGVLGWLCAVLGEWWRGPRE